MSPVTTQEVLNERPPTKRVTFADEPQIETLPDYSSTSSSSNEPLYLPPPRPQCTFEPHEQREETIIQPGYWYPTASPLPRLPLRSIELTEKLIDQKLEKEMALDPELFNKKEPTKKRGLFSKVLKSKALDFPNRKVIEQIRPEKSQQLYVNRKKSLWYTQCKMIWDKNLFLTRYCLELVSPEA